MTNKLLPAALLCAALPWFAFAAEPVPAAPVAPATAAPPAVTAEGVAADPAAADPAATPAGDALTTPPGKKPICGMKGRGALAGPPVGPGKDCGWAGHPGGPCPHEWGGHGPAQQDLEQRLDLIEARLAKIEALLEGLIRR